MRFPILHRPNLNFAVICLCVFSSTFLNADIVFLSDRDGSIPTYECDVYVMDDNGVDVRRLTTDLLYKARPHFSPNGSQIVFAVELIKPRQKDWGPDQTIELFIMNANGSKHKQLTYYKGLSTHPTWSPDGQSIAFIGNHTSNLEIHRMDLRNGRVSQITNSFAEHNGSVSSPDWSADGKKIAYSLAIKGKGTHIYIIDIDGKNPRPLVKPEKQEPDITNYDVVPKWHPDSEHILYRKAAFTLVQKGDVAVFQPLGRGALAIRREGSPDSEELKIPEELVFRTGTWAEGGNAVIFNASDGGDPDNPTDIYRYNMFTHEITNISNHPGKDFSPHWVNPTYSVPILDLLTTQWAQLKKKKD